MACVAHAGNRTGLIRADNRTRADGMISALSARLRAGGFALDRAAAQPLCHRRSMRSSRATQPDGISPTAASRSTTRFPTRDRPSASARRPAHGRENTITRPLTRWGSSPPMSAVKRDGLHRARHVEERRLRRFVRARIRTVDAADYRADRRGRQGDRGCQRSIRDSHGFCRHTMRAQNQSRPIGGGRPRRYASQVRRR